MLFSIAINTDEGSWYNEMGEHFASHDTVNQSKDEYVRYFNEVTNETRPTASPASSLPTSRPTPLKATTQSSSGA
jgi:hypothetical protein